jgi:hypothetical protein
VSPLNERFELLKEFRMSPMPPPDLPVSYSEAEWLRFVTADRRPNLLVSCSNSGVGPVVAQLMDVCNRPMHVRQLPNALDLGPETRGTVLICDVARLTFDQQLELYGWLSERRPDTQVVSITSASLPALVASGRFHEGLFYRLNVVSLTATVGDGRKRAGLDTPKYPFARPRFDCASLVGQVLVSTP